MILSNFLRTEYFYYLVIVWEMNTCVTKLLPKKWILTTYNNSRSLIKDSTGLHLVYKISLKILKLLTISN